MNRRELLKQISLPVLFGPDAVGQANVGTGLPTDNGFFNVLHFGATGDGKTVDSPAINRAIEELASQGGGTLVFPAGTYVCFTLRLKSLVDLHLARGCTILAADSPLPHQQTGYRGGTYDAAEPAGPWNGYQDYGHNHWRNSLFYAEGEHDFGVTGPGLIFGRGLSNGSRSGRDSFEGFVAEQSGVGNKAFGLKHCRNVLLRDISIFKGGHFAVLATGCDNLAIDHVTVDTDRDGLDIDCCRNVRVSNCTVNSPWDDAICPKSSYALGYARATENVTIANNYVTAAYELGSVIAGTWKKFPEDTTVIREGRIKCGTESNGGFKNITITGNVIEGCKGIALESSDGALLEDIAITGNVMRDIVDVPLYLRLNKRNRNPLETLRPGAVRRILISNLVCHNSAASTSSVISGVPGLVVEDIKIANCFLGHEGLPRIMRVNWGGESRPMPDWKTITVPEMESAYPEPLQLGPTPCHGFFLRHLRNLEMSHVEIAPARPDPRPAFCLNDVHRADFFAVTAPAQQNFSLRQVSDVRIAWSRATPDAVIASTDAKLI